MASDAEIAISGSGKFEDGAMKRIEHRTHLSIGVLGNRPLFIMFRVTFTACGSGRESIFWKRSACEVSFAANTVFAKRTSNTSRYAANFII